MESGGSDVVGRGLERIESEQVVNAQATRNALDKQFIRLAKLEDTTPSVMNVERLEFRNATAVLVTHFDEGQPGQRIEVLGDGNTTIENNARIVTASGADTLLDADVTYAFTRYTDGKWHQSAGGGTGGGGGGSGVTSFVGRTGVVVAVASDYTPAFIGAEAVANKGAPSGYADLDSGGLVPAGELGTGTADATTFLRGDGTWDVPAGGGGGSTAGLILGYAFSNTTNVVNPDTGGDTAINALSVTVVLAAATDVSIRFSVRASKAGWAVLSIYKNGVKLAPLAGGGAPPPYGWYMNSGNALENNNLQATVEYIVNLPAGSNQIDIYHSASANLNPISFYERSLIITQMA